MMLKEYGKKIDSIHSIHFLHGNSLNPDSYDEILRKLNEKNNIETFYFRPLWTKNQKPTFKNWDIFLNDYLKSIKYKTNIIGIGHSFGGNIILKAALRYPDKFEKIILLDPTFFTPINIILWKFINIFNLQKYFLPLVKSAERKKMSFKNKEEMFLKYRKSNYFRNFDDITLKKFLKSIVLEHDDKIKLVFPKAWDIRIYKKGLLNDFYIWRNIKKLTVDTLIIRAENSDVFLKKTEKLVNHKNKKIKTITINKSDHMFPINNSIKTIDLINHFI